MLRRCTILGLPIRLGLMGIALLATGAFASATGAATGAATLTAPGTARLAEIADHDTGGRLLLRRGDVVLDAKLRRVSDKVYGPTGRLEATEKFSYDRAGRLSRRVYRLTSGSLKWQWTRFKHNEAGEPLTCDIVNGKGKKIGRNVWHYDKPGRMTRRDRHNADGSVRFYYASVEFDEQGNFSRWTKYEPPKRPIAVKTWKFIPSDGGLMLQSGFDVVRTSGVPLAGMRQ